MHPISPQNLLHKLTQRHPTAVLNATIIATFFSLPILACLGKKPGEQGEAREFEQIQITLLTTFAPVSLLCPPVWNAPVLGGQSGLWPPWSSSCLLSANENWIKGLIELAQWVAGQRGWQVSHVSSPPPCILPLRFATSVGFITRPSLAKLDATKAKLEQKTCPFSAPLTHKMRVRKGLIFAAKCQIFAPSPQGEEKLNLSSHPCLTSLFPLPEELFCQPHSIISSEPGLRGKFLKTESKVWEEEGFGSHHLLLLKYTHSPLYT